MLTFSENYRNLRGGYTVADDQVEGIDYLLARTSAILSFSTGKGKTLTSLVSLKILLDRYLHARVLIVCPVKALKIFKKELTTKLGYSLSEVGIISTAEEHYSIDNNRIIVVTDTNIPKHTEITRLWTEAGYKSVLLIDEAHKLQDPSSLFVRTMEEVKKFVTVIWGLTATPILNDLESLFYIVNFVRPGFLGTKTAFLNRYTVWKLKSIYIKGGAKRKVKDLQGYKNLDELNNRLKELILVRGFKYNLKFGVQSVALTPEESEMYERVSVGIFGDEEREFTRRMHDLQRLVDHAYEKDGEIVQMVSDSGSDISTKENLLLDVIKSGLSKGLGLIVYADYRDTIERLEYVLQKKRQSLGLGNIYLITGSVDISVREKVEEQISPRDVVLITSAGSESVNLQRANCVIFYDIPFSVKTIIQTCGRICRRDTKHSAQYIIALYTKGTIDEYKYLIYQSNLKLVQTVLGVGTDLPLDSIGVEQKNLQTLKDRLLWHYKNIDGKEEKRMKRKLKKGLPLLNVEESKTAVVSFRLCIEPIPCTGVSHIKGLYPDPTDFQKYSEGLLPFTVLRSRYREFLKSGKADRFVRSIQSEVLEKGSVVALVSDSDLNKTLQDYILETYQYKR